jgi:hypothetical protein
MFLAAAHAEPRIHDPKDFERASHAFTRAISRPNARRQGSTARAPVCSRPWRSWSSAGPHAPFPCRETLPPRDVGGPRAHGRSPPACADCSGNGWRRTSRSQAAPLASARLCAAEHTRGRVAHHALMRPADPQASTPAPQHASGIAASKPFSCVHRNPDTLRYRWYYSLVRHPVANGHD